MILECNQGKFSKFFGPSPRKLWLTVYRGLQVLRIVLSDSDEGQEQPSFGIILEPSDSPMSIEMLCTEPS